MFEEVFFHIPRRTEGAAPSACVQRLKWKIVLNMISIKKILKCLMFQMSVWTTCSKYTSCPPGIWTLFCILVSGSCWMAHSPAVQPICVLCDTEPPKLVQLLFCSYLLIQWKVRTAGKSSLGPWWRADTEQTCSSFDVDGTQALAWRQSECWPGHRHQQ